MLPPDGEVPLTFRISWIAGYVGDFTIFKPDPHAALGMGINITDNDKLIRRVFMRSHFILLTKMLI